MKVIAEENIRINGVIYYKNTPFECSKGTFNSLLEAGVKIKEVKSDIQRNRIPAKTVQSED